MSPVNRNKLFWGSCFALIATSVAFAMVGAVMGPLKEIFILTNEQVGWIGGAALWGFPITIIIFGPLCDAIGIRKLLYFALFGHVCGVLLMVFATGFWMLFAGALVIAMGNGLVEAVCNPLVATIYPDRKTEMLNKFHVWFPGGIVIGGVIAFGLDSIGIVSWQLKLLVVLIPALVYGVMFLKEDFPATERKQSGISFAEMVRETLFRPLFLLLCFCIMMSASIELGPNRWIPAVLESVGIPGILVLVWINLLMAVLRFYSGPLVHRLSPTGILMWCSLLSGLGLFLLSYTNTFATAILAGTVFAVGVCYFWPTLLGIVSERVPKGGAMALSVISGVGMLTVGIFTSPAMGKIADIELHERLPVADTIAVLQAFGETSYDAPAGELAPVRENAGEVLAQYVASQRLPQIQTANTLRSIINTVPGTEVARQARSILGPAENQGGKSSFRYVAPFSIVLLIIFTAIYLRDKRTGGYKVEKIQ